MARPGIGYPVYQQPSRVTFGTGSVKTLVDEGIESAVVFLTSQAPVRTAVDAALARRGARLDDSRIVVKPAGEPTADMIGLGAEFLSRRQPSRIVAIGGGSVLDWCRLSWAASRGLLSIDSGRVAPLDDPRARPELWLVPTTCGTGAEAAGVAVYSDHGRKIAAVSRTFIADQVILDAQFLRTVDAFGMACALADTLSHAIEASVSIVPGTLAKEAGAGALRLVLENAGLPPGVCRDERLMEAGYLGGVAASNCSVGVVHAFAHSVAHAGIRHGQGNAIALAAGIQANAEAPAMRQLPARVGIPDPPALISRVREIVAAALDGASLDPLRQLLQREEERAQIADRMAADVCLRSNPRAMSRDDLLAFLRVVEETLDPSWCLPS